VATPKISAVWNFIRILKVALDPDFIANVGSRFELRDHLTTV